MATTTHYLSNKELLREIHNSKMSYSWCADDRYYYYDLIIEDFADLNADAIASAKEVRASRLQKLAHEAEVARWEKGELERKTKPRAIDFAVDPATISDNDIVIRLMTFEHIPTENRKANPKSVADNHSRCNFPPYKHLALNADNQWYEVARSHWEGSLDNGHFSVSHGQTNSRLARMYIKLCERYSMRGNWRGYTYVDEMRGQALLQLAQIGLQFNEARSQNPFAYYTAAINNSFTRVLNLEKRNQNIRDDLLEEEGLEPSFTRTFNAEWATKMEQNRPITTDPADIDFTPEMLQNTEEEDYSDLMDPDEDSDETQTQEIIGE
jgi:hypothetical protein